MENVLSWRLKSEWVRTWLLARAGDYHLSGDCDRGQPLIVDCDVSHGVIMTRVTQVGGECLPNTSPRPLSPSLAWYRCVPRHNDPIIIVQQLHTEIFNQQLSRNSFKLFLLAQIFELLWWHSHSSLSLSRSHVTWKMTISMKISGLVLIYKPSVCIMNSEYINSLEVNLIHILN